MVAAIAAGLRRLIRRRTRPNLALLFGSSSRVKFERVHDHLACGNFNVVEPDIDASDDVMPRVARALMVFVLRDRACGHAFWRREANKMSGSRQPTSGHCGGFQSKWRLPGAEVLARPLQKLGRWQHGTRVSRLIAGHEAKASEGLGRNELKAQLRSLCQKL
ncbi:hypothetical protein EOB36_10775 [Mesorhizobium sp. M6A.T.Cr.TU.017.01.1.1]|uniref:hypothetical protein n=1 Tax=Mesorhizobium sp. M6A.T.Cr.TU.017.01.1.1 TaxID=2496774 RepID=UPI000FD3FC81|nr:hypothetical protein [Mesorhizobium sp. M6A.T.Cr.TU.017.01.1.1]RUV02126.1 hypothetical protein EOB36_10775 [Mesorhizobium sp. M6A.T.Cr.TU.017.01.1.1]